MTLPFYSYNSFLSKKFGTKVRKISIDAGFTCPNINPLEERSGCTYCNNNAFSPGHRKITTNIESYVKSEIEKLKEKLGAEKFIAYFQSYSNTNKDVKELENIYRSALSHEDVIGIAIGTRADCIDDEKLNLLETLSKETYLSVEYGVQSIYDDTLNKINRGHSFEILKDVVKKSVNRGFDVCLHVILGFPWETHKEIIETAETLNKLNYTSLKLHNLHIIKDTKMEEEYKKGGMNLLTMEEHVSYVVDFLERTDKNIIIQRFIGDAPKPFLVAPLWCKSKAKVINMVIEEFKQRKSYQGIYV